jgi:lysozyme family protein
MDAAVGPAGTVAADVAAFQAVVSFVIDVSEGGGKLITDQGGATRFGISQRAHPDVDVPTLTREGAVALYRARYWQKIQGDSLPRAVALAVFDAAVNMSPAPAIKLLQRVLRVDGVMGPVTVAAVGRANPVALIAAFLGERCRFYRHLAEDYPGQHRSSLDGWNNRICHLGVECGRWLA